MNCPKKNLLVTALVALIAADVVSAADIHSSAPPNFKKVSSLVKLPDYLPGMGTLHVDPSTLPAGPFLGYSKAGKLVNVIYMVPMKQFEEHKTLGPLGTAVKGLKIDHTDMSFNPGHPGVEEPHYHITQWLISHEEHEKTMN